MICSITASGRPIPSRWKSRDGVFGPAVDHQRLEPLGQVVGRLALTEVERRLRQEQVGDRNALAGREQGEHGTGGMTENGCLTPDGRDHRGEILGLALGRVRSGVAAVAAGTTVEGDALIPRRREGRGERTGRLRGGERAADDHDRRPLPGRVECDRCAIR